MAKPVPLTPEEAAQYRKYIQNLASQAADGQEEQMRKQYRMLTLSHGLGKSVYDSYSDEELLLVLHHAAAVLGHAPAQHEVFFLYRNYLKARFRTWPGALRAAGMRWLPAADLEMPDWMALQTAEPDICSALQVVAELQEKLGYPPRKKDVPQAKVLCERFRSWENTIAASEAFCRWKQERRNCST